MDVVAAIFDALGEATVIASSLKEPVQTVHSWKANKRIPPWRRSALLDVTPVDGKRLAPEALAYLRSTERDPLKATPDTPTQAEAA